MRKALVTGPAFPCLLLFMFLIGCAEESPPQDESLSRQAEALPASPAASGDDADADVVIHNARIIEGNGQTIERGTIVLKDGRIELVIAGPMDIAAVRQVDASGLTVMPGFIDGHRHVIQGNPGEWLAERRLRMREYLEAGFTTIQSCGDPLEQIVGLRQELESNEIAGPRLLTSGFVPLAGGPERGGPPREDPARAERSWAPRLEAAQAIPAETTRQTVQQYAAAGVDALKTVLMVTPDGPEKDTLELVVAEGRKAGIPVITHAVTVEDTMAAVAADVAALVHTPVDGDLDENRATTIADSGIPMMSTLGVFVPYFGDDNEALFRDGTPFPWERLYHAGEGAVNARLLWNAGTTLGFGTDTPFGPNTGWTPRDALAHELRSLSLVFSPRDMVSILTRNAAATLGRGDEIGTLEAGKLADIVLVDGDPLSDMGALLNVKLVIKGGEIVLDRR